MKVATDPQQLLRKMRRNIKQQKQKLISMIELPPLYDESGENSGNRIHQRRSIINELDLIKARVHQVMPCSVCVYIHTYTGELAVLQIVHVCYADNTKL